jgi:hypothetical protein
MGIAQHARVFLPAVIAVWLLCVAPVAAAPPDVTSLFPAGGALGETPEVTLTGTFNHWPVQFWCSNPRLKVDCGSSKGKLVIHIPADAPCGVAWLRLIDEEGASVPRPFVIAAQPSVSEKEPNDSPKVAQQVVLPAVVHGKFDKNGDSDGYRVELAAGQTLVAALQSNEILGSPADGALQVCNEVGQVLAMNQDAGGLDSLLTFRAEVAGTYLVRTFAFPAVPNSSINFAGGELFIYRLTLTTGPYADYTFPLAVSREPTTELKLQGWNVPEEKVALSLPTGMTSEPWHWTPPNAAGLIPLRTVDVPLIVATANAATEMGQPIEASCCITGVIAKPREAHRLTFDGMKGMKLAITAESAALAFDLDPHLKLVAPDGKILNEVDDTGKNPDPVLNVTLAADGQYTLELRDQFRSGGPRHVYRLLIETPQPRLALSVAAGNFLLEADKPLEIPITITRQNGFSGEVKITAVDLPEGVSVIFGTSQNKGDTAKSVKLMLTATAAAKAGPIRIVAQDSDDKEIATATFAQTLGGSTFQHSNVWVAVKGAK